MLSFGQEGYQGLSEHLNLAKNLHEAEEPGKNMRRASACSGSWAGSSKQVVRQQQPVHREPFCLSTVAFTATLVTSHLLC